MTKGLLLHPSLSLEEHLSKFPLCNDCQFSYSPSFVCNVREKCPAQRWFKEYEKLCKAKVSQIQDVFDQELGAFMKDQQLPQEIKRTISILLWRIKNDVMKALLEG